MSLEVIPIAGIGEISVGDELGAIVLDAAEANATPLLGNDCLVLTQKVVSKAEGRVVDLGPGSEAKAALVASESARVLRRRGDLSISETHHGFVCANAGVDLSNVAPGRAALLPVEPDRSARHVRDAIRARSDIDVAVIVSDTFGRPWRNGVTDVAIGVSGLRALLDLRGTTDALGNLLEVTEVAVADEIAGAADLVMGKATNVPAAIVRGIDPAWFGTGRGRDLVRNPSEDLFR